MKIEIQSEQIVADDEVSFLYKLLMDDAVILWGLSGYQAGKLATMIRTLALDTDTVEFGEGIFND
jgi:hypothetical protein